EEQRRDLERVRARGGEQRAPHAERRFEKLVAAARVLLIARDLPDPHRVRDVLELASDERRAMERDAVAARARVRRVALAHDGAPSSPRTYASAKRPRRAQSGIPRLSYS